MIELMNIESLIDDLYAVDVEIANLRSTLDDLDIQYARYDLFCTQEVCDSKKCSNQFDRTHLKNKLMLEPKGLQLKKKQNEIEHEIRLKVAKRTHLYQLIMTLRARLHPPYPPAPSALSDDPDLTR